MLTTLIAHELMSSHTSARFSEVSSAQHVVPWVAASLLASDMDEAWMASQYSPLYTALSAPRQPFTVPWRAILQVPGQKLRSMFFIPSFGAAPMFGQPCSHVEKKPGPPDPKTASTAASSSTQSVIISRKVGAASPAASPTAPSPVAGVGWGETG